MAAHTGQTYFFFAPLFIPFFILGVPIVDMAFAFVRRTANRTGFSTPDKNHLHHRLLRLGHGHRRSVLILWAWTVLLSGFILFPLYISSVNAIIPFGALALGVVLYTLFHPSLRRQAEPGPEDQAPAEAELADGPGSRPTCQVRPRAGRPLWPVCLPRPAIDHGPDPAPELRVSPRGPPGPGVTCKRGVRAFCRDGSESAMIHAVNCRPHAPSEGIHPARGAIGSGRSST